MSRISILLLAVCGLCSSTAGAQDYPAKQVLLIVPFPPGGVTTVFARTMAESLKERLGQTVTVENRAGRFGAVASEDVAKAAPDGYTLLMATTITHAVAPASLSPAPYDPATSFTPV